MKLDSGNDVAYDIATIWITTILATKPSLSDENFFVGEKINLEETIP